jgi:hypothetical protein
MVSFVSFLLSFKNEDSAVGDLARDASMDDRINKRWGFNKFMEHLLNVNACEGARLSAQIAFHRYSQK